MARPAKYDWKAIEADFKAGINKDRICRKYSIEEKTLNNKIYEKKWIVSGNAKSIMAGLSEVSGSLGQMEIEEPEILEAVYNRIRTESEFDLVAGRLVTKTMKKLEKLVDCGIKSEKLNVGGGMQAFETVEMMGGDYLDVMNAAYRGKELLKGKEAPATVQINNTNAIQNSIQTKTLLL
jgi:hypothetical protein